MVFHWSLSDSNSPKVSRIVLSILAVLNNAVVWMVSTHHPTSKSSRPFNNPSVTVPKAQTTIGIIVTFMFHSFFPNSLARSRYLSFFSLSFSFIRVIRDSKVLNFGNSLFLLFIMRPGLLADIRWSVCISKSHRSLRVSILLDRCWVVHIPLFVSSNLNF